MTGDLSKDFWSSEFECNGLTCCDFSAPMDRRFIEKLQKLRDLIGPIEVTSGFRCKTHNKAIGGSKNSYHTKGLAADITAGMKPVNLAEKAQEVGFKGIGIYSTWVHVDDRDYPARW